MRRARTFNPDKFPSFYQSQKLVGGLIVSTNDTNINGTKEDLCGSSMCKDEVFSLLT